MSMNIVVVGGTGLIGSRLVANLRGNGHAARPASPATGVNALTGDGLAGILRGADVVVDVSNSPSFDEAAVMHFFTTSTRNLLAAEAEHGVRHHVALSVVGTDRVTDSPYFRAKRAQEELIAAGPVPYTIVRATQFFEFAKSIADAATDGSLVLIPPALVQPIAADDVAEAVARVAVAAPLHGVIEVAGPRQFGFAQFVQLGLAARGDPREVASDPDARYFGAKLRERSLIPGDGAQLASTRYEDWLAIQAR
jgi:uncharacterized protein YbjT (DUF2867 family)